MIGGVPASGGTNGTNDELHDDHTSGTPDEDTSATDLLNHDEGIRSGQDVDEGGDEGDEEGVADGSELLEEDRTKKGMGEACLPNSGMKKSSHSEYDCRSCAPPEPLRYHTRVVLCESVHDLTLFEFSYVLNGFPAWPTGQAQSSTSEGDLQLRITTLSRQEFCW